MLHEHHEVVRTVYICIPWMWMGRTLYRQIDT